ncbi:hypothetical protein [Bacillus sp. Marseille-P3661]|uniref:hypothetical protein n=1 Tax=Bacillus sp. Marseille-P3661 TaxID=1936234 RepID=UPI001159DCA3|nr:hypothetical protein [Bacillus sp. Marseille-P3661]
MDNQLTDELLELIPITILLLIGWFLWKKRILRFSSGKYLDYTDSYTKRSCRATYKLFHGFKYFYFRFKKGSVVIVSYSAKVEKGTLTITLRNRKGELFKKTFSSDEGGKYQFAAEEKSYSIQIDGNNTQGSCFIEFQVEN